MATSRQLIINSQFKPFSYSEMLHPVMMADTAHKELEDSLGELQMKAGIWENLANEQKDERAYRMYKDYADTLKQEVGVLAASGLGPSSRQNLNNLRQRYVSDIVPIETAYNVRSEQAKMQQAERNKDQTIRYNRDAADTSLDVYLDNPNLGYRAVSGNVLAGQVAVAADALQRDIIDNPTKYSSILGGQYIEAVQRNGFSAAEIDKAVRGDADANPILTQVVNNVMDSADIGDFSEQTAAELRRLASQGLYKAVGETKTQYLDPWKAKMDYQADIQDRQAVVAHERALELAGARGRGGSGAGAGEKEGKYRRIPSAIVNAGLTGEALKEAKEVRQDELGVLYTEDTLKLREAFKELERQEAEEIEMYSRSNPQTIQSEGLASAISIGRDVGYVPITAEQKQTGIASIKAKYDRARSNLNAELGGHYKEFNRILAKYGELVPGDKAASVTKGMQLEKAQAVTQQQRILASHDNTAEENRNIISTIRLAKQKDPNIGFRELNEKTGTFSEKIISRAEENKLFLGKDGRGSDNMFSSIDTQHGQLYVDRTTGKKYKFSGELHVDDYDKKFSAAYNVTRDFSSKGTAGMRELDYDSTIGELEDRGELANFVREHGRNEGNDIKTYTVRDVKDGNIIKITVVGNSDPIISSLNDELYNNGRDRNKNTQAWMRAGEEFRQQIFQTPEQLKQSGTTYQGTEYR